MDYESIEKQQESLLPSEFDQLEEELSLTYDEYLREKGEITEVKPVSDRLKQMEKSALDVYEQGLTDPSIQFSQRRQVADKVLEITGVIDKNKDKGNSGNTFVFSDKFAEKFMKVAERFQNTFEIEDSDSYNETEQPDERLVN